MFKIIFISLMLASVPVMASAEPVSENRTVKVADLDLAAPSGKVQLDQRIVEACGEASNVDLAGRNAVRACRADARAKAHEAQQFRLARRSPAPVAAGQQ